jgi:hypothetical protein
MDSADHGLRARLAAATLAERSMLAAALGVTLSGSDEEVVDRLAAAYVEDSGDRSYRDLMAAVAEQLRLEAGWRAVKIQPFAQAEWIEEYCSRAAAFADRPDRKTLSRAEVTSLREQAEACLAGNVVSAGQQVEQAWKALVGPAVAVLLLVVLAAVGGWLLLSAGAAVHGLIRVVAGLVGAGARAAAQHQERRRMARVTPATLVFIHIRKRLEFEEIVRKYSEAS